MKSKRSVSITLAALAALIILSLGVGIQTTVSALDLLEEKLTQTDLLIEVMNTIEKNYVDGAKVAPKELIDSAIEGMVGSLDPHCMYLDADSAKAFNEQTQGEFQGLGITIERVGPWLTVVQVLEGTPAQKAGLQPEDRIVYVDGERLIMREEGRSDGITLQEATNKLKGPAGSVVKLRVARRGENKLLDIDVTRDVIHPSAIATEITPRMLDKRTGYIRLQDFTKDAANELGTQIDRFLAQGMDALVLDLRDNLGGLLDVAVQVCDLFVDKGKLIVTYRGRAGDEKEYIAQTPPRGDFLLAVLVNEYSASASEIVAGCIQDWSRGIIVGSAGSPKPQGRTFGKGSVQTLISLTTVEGAQLKITTAKYYTPLNRSIQAPPDHPELGGIVPDVLAPVTQAEHFAIRTKRLYGNLPPDSIADSYRIAEATTSQPDHELTVEEIFHDDNESSSANPDEVKYDLELLSAYQHLNSARVLVKASPGTQNVAGAGH